MAGPLSEAEIQQRRDAAKARWAAAAGVAGAAAAGYSAPKAFLSPRAPTRDEVKAAYRQEGKGTMTALRMEGADKATRSRIWAGMRGKTMEGVKQTLRPIGNRKVQAASAVGLALIAAGVALPGVMTARDITKRQVAKDEATHAERAGRALAWGGAAMGGMGALRAALPVVRRVPRAAIATAGLGAAALGATRKDR